MSSARETVLGADRPMLIEAWVNADVPTVPPTLDAKHAEKLEKALDAGGFQRMRIAREWLRQPIPDPVLVTPLRALRIIPKIRVKKQGPRMGRGAARRSLHGSMTFGNRFGPRGRREGS